MKKLFFSLISFLIIEGSVSAQDTTRQKAGAPIQKRDRIHQENHLMYMDGKLYRVQQGKRTQVQEQITLQNGTVIHPNGSYQSNNQQNFQLRNGQCMDMNGNVYQSRRMFDQKRMMTEQQIDRNRNWNQNPGGGNKNQPRAQGGRRGGRS